jgi:hypothetical protein
MNAFPEFMKNPANAIVSQRSDCVEGYVFDGIDGSQIAVFQCSKDGVSKEHVHDFDEYFVVVRGEYTLGIDGEPAPTTASPRATASGARTCTASRIRLPASRTCSLRPMSSASAPAGSARLKKKR